MAVRARPDNLGLDHPADAGTGGFEFDELWGLRDDLRAVCRRMVGDEGRADDVVQDTFVRALNNAGHLDRRSSYAPWLATVARRRSIDELRARKRLRLVAEAPEPAIAPAHRTDPLEQVLQQEAVERVRIALGELSPRERQLLLRQVTHGLSMAELAQEESTSVASVRSVLARARIKLRAAVERDGPLGAAPGLGLAAAVRRRLHRWAARLDGRTSLVAGAGMQLGDVVAAAVAALVLLAGTPSGVGTTDADLQAASTARETAASTADGPASSSSSPDAGPGRPITTTTSSTTTTSAPGPVPPPDWNVVPMLPHDGVTEPEDLVVARFSRSADHRIVFATGKTTKSDWAVLRSDDNGATWARLHTSPVEQRLLVPPTFPADPTLFVVTNASLLRSDDEGNHFYPVAPAREFVVALAPDYAQSRRVLLAGNPLLEYEATGFPGTVRPLQAVPPSVTLGGIVGGWNDGGGGTTLVGGTSEREGRRTTAVYACTSTACSLHAGIEGTDPAKLFRSDAVPGVVFAWRGERVHRSDDGGRTFAPVGLAGISVDNIVDGGRGELFLTGTNLSTASSVHRSTDGGRTWRPFGIGTPLASATRAITRLASGRLLAAALDDARSTGAHCSDDNGRSWSRRCA